MCEVAPKSHGNTMPSYRFEVKAAGMEEDI